MKGLRVLVAFAFVLQLTFPSLILAAQSSVGHFSAVSGEVSLIRGGTQTKPIVKSAVYAGDIVATGKNGTAKITLTDESVLTLTKNSRFQIKNYDLRSNQRHGRFHLAFGNLMADVKRFIGGSNRFEVESPTAVAGLRGTVIEYTVVIGANGVPTTTVTCVSGSVTITTASGSVTLVAGQTAVAVGAAAPAVTTATTAAAAAGAAGGTATTAGIGAGTVAIGAAVAAAGAAALVSTTGADNNLVPVPAHHTTSHHSP
jgi:hypothetical protein